MVRADTNFHTKLKRKWPLWIAGTFAILIGLAFVYYRFLLDWNGQPFCHKQIMFGFLNVMHTNSGDILNDPKPYPNIKGLSRDSLESIHESMCDYMGWAKDYNYVPGLREDDPQELVLMYFNRPTRWNWHGVPQTIFTEKGWIIIPVDFDTGSGFPPHTGQLGECSERVSFEEFRIRLKRTLDFIRTNQRPNWQAIVAEHTKFLDSITNQSPSKSK